MTTDVACFTHEIYIAMLWPLSWHDDNWRNMIYTLGIYNHALSVLWDDGNWRSMFNTCMIYYHALTVVMRRWQLTEHVSYLRDISPCSYRCLETMTTYGACFKPYGWITMLCPLSGDDDNWRSMFHSWEIYHHALTVVMTRWLRWSMISTFGIYNHALYVVMRRWQLTEHVHYMHDILPCSDRCHETITTDGACFIS